MERDDKIARLKQVKTRMAAMPPFSDDTDAWLLAEHQKLHAMDDAPLSAEYQTSFARVQNEQRQKRRDELVLQTYAERRSSLSHEAGDLTREVANTPHPVLKDAIAQLEAEVQGSEEVGRSMVTFAQVPGAAAMTSSAGRTAAHEAATQRKRYALTSLKLLIPMAGDPTQAIRQILNDLRKSEMDALPNVLQPAQPPRRKQKGPFNDPHTIAALELG
jgi:hypothetical protein